MPSGGSIYNAISNSFGQPSDLYGETDCLGLNIGFTTQVTSLSLR